MDKYYLFKLERKLDTKTIRGIIDSFYQKEYIFVETNIHEGYIIADEGFASLVSEAVPTINSDLGAKFVLVCAHTYNEISRGALQYAFENMQGFNYLSDIILEQMLVSFSKIKQLMADEFKRVPHELILTASAYLRAGLNAKVASEMLYIHRNTFNYRLAKFIELTNLDIRDYWNAFYFNIFLRLNKK